MRLNSGWGSVIRNLKDLREAIRVLNELFSTFLSPARMAQVFTLLGDNHLELKDPLNWSPLVWKGSSHSRVTPRGTEEEGEIHHRLLRYGGGVNPDRIPLPRGLWGRLCKIEIGSMDEASRE